MKRRISFVTSLLLLVGWFSLNVMIYRDKNWDSLEYPEGMHNEFMVTAQNNALVEGHRKIVGAVQKDSKKFQDTGGWGFEGFRGETRERVVSDTKNTCFHCHESQRI